MDIVDELWIISKGDMSCDNAKIIIEKACQDASSLVIKELGIALRAWTWKAITNGRSQSDLRDLHDILRRVSTRLATIDFIQATRVELLSELVHESLVDNLLRGNK